MGPFEKTTELGVSIIGRGDGGGGGGGGRHKQQTRLSTRGNQQVGSGWQT